jgi:Ca2+-binding EF-hand superfamily protein
MGSELSAEELDAAMAAMDADGSGGVDFDELKQWFDTQPESPLAAMLRQKVPVDQTACERSLVQFMQAARAAALARLDFRSLDAAALRRRHRRRRAVVTARQSPRKSLVARSLQPNVFAHRSQAERGGEWSTKLGDADARQLLKLVEGMQPHEGTSCACCIYDRVVLRHPEAEVEEQQPSLEGLSFCLCKRRTDLRQAGGGDPAALIAKLFAEIDTDGSGTLDRGEVAAVAAKLGLRLGKRQLDEAMRAMDEDGSGEVDAAEFAAWWVSPAAKGFAAALLACAQCAEYGLGFNCGGWSAAGYTAWHADAPAARPASRQPSAADTVALPAVLAPAAPATPPPALPFVPPYRRESARAAQRKSPARFFDSSGLGSTQARMMTPTAALMSPAVRAGRKAGSKVGLRAAPYFPDEGYPLGPSDADGVRQTMRQTLTRLGGSGAPATLGSTGEFGGRLSPSGVGRLPPSPELRRPEHPGQTPDLRPLSRPLPSPLPARSTPDGGAPSMRSTLTSPMVRPGSLSPLRSPSPRRRSGGSQKQVRPQPAPSPLTARRLRAGCGLQYVVWSGLSGHAAVVIPRHALGHQRAALPGREPDPCRRQDRQLAGARVPTGPERPTDRAWCDVVLAAFL